MKTMSITPGNMIIPIDDEKLISKKHIVILVNPILNTVYLINAEDKPIKPISLKLDVIEDKILQKKLEVSEVVYSYYSMLQDSELDPKWVKKRDERLSIIDSIIKDKQSLESFLNASSTNPVVKTIADKNQCSRDSVYKFAYSYLQGGQRKNALLPHYNKIGKSSSKKSKVGAKTDGESIGIPVTENSKAYENIKTALKKYYRNNEKKTYQYAYDKMCDDNYSSQVWNDDKGKYEVIHYDDNTKPSIDQFKYWARKILDPVKTSKQREGRSKHEANFRPLPSTSDYNVRGPGEKYEIDATIGDIYLVSAFDRTRTTSIGRPVIYLVTDVYSRCIVGLYVGLEGPSWNGARAALYNTFRNKVDYCAEFGIEITEDQWPCHHVCVEIFADRGEMIGKDAESLLDNIGVKSMGFAGPYRGDLKGLVEQNFNTLNKRTIEHIPGNSVKIKRNRGERKPEWDGLLTIGELTAIIINDILDYNKYQTKEVVGNIEMIKDKIIPTPLNLWNWGMEFGIGCANTINQNDLYLGLLPKEKASVRGDGIYFNGLRYSSETAIKNGWQSKVRMSGKRFNVDIRYTKSTTNFIWLINPETKKTELCPLNDVMEKFKNLRFDEYLDQAERSNKSIRQAKRVRKKAEAKTRATNEEIIKKARDEKGKKKHKPTNIKSNRNNEKQHERKNDAKTALAASNEKAIESQNKPTKDSSSTSKNLEQETLNIIDELF